MGSASASLLVLLALGFAPAGAEPPAADRRVAPGGRGGSSSRELRVEDGASVQLRLRIGRSELRPQGTIGDVALGELSPLNTAGFASGSLRITISSPFFFIPPYRITARSLLPPDPTPGNFSTTDVGFGVIGVSGCNPVIQPAFDYDPRTVSKDVDGIPQFLGTVGALPLGAPGAELFRTSCFFFGQTNTFTFVYAVGPQFFTPAGSTDFDVVLTLELI